MEHRIRPVGDPVALVGSFRAISSMVLGVKGLEGREELLGDAVFLVEGDGGFDGRVGDEVAVG